MFLPLRVTRASHPPRVCLRSPEQRKHATLVLQARLTPAVLQNSVKSTSRSLRLFKCVVGFTVAVWYGILGSGSKLVSRGRYFVSLVVTLSSQNASLNITTVGPTKISGISDEMLSVHL